MHTWNRYVTTLTTNEIHEAIKDDVWQTFRLSLKGVSTETKLFKLEEYLNRREMNGGIKREDQVRVDNYINALLRGGQLKRVMGGEIKVQR